MTPLLIWPFHWPLGSEKESIAEQTANDVIKAGGTPADARNAADQVRNYYERRSDELSADFWDKLESTVKVAIVLIALFFALMIFLELRK